MRTFIVFRDNYITQNRSLEMIKRSTLQELLDVKGIDYGEKDSEEEAVKYIDNYNGDGDNYWMIYEICLEEFKLIVS